MLARDFFYFLLTQESLPVKTSSYRSHGFTLIELAISLMVIGLLIGGVLKGQELINNARNLKIVRDMSGYKTATMIFKDTYGYLPGDVPNPTTHLPNCATGTACAGIGWIMQSPGNGIFDAAGYFNIPGVPWFQQIHQIYAAEPEQFWHHLMAAQMITSQTLAYGSVESAAEGMYLFVHSYAGTVVGNPIDTRNYLVLSPQGRFSWGTPGITPSVAEYIDQKLDDGKPYSGDVRAIGEYDSAIVDPGCVAASTTVYLTSSQQKKCAVALKLE